MLTSNERKELCQRLRERVNSDDRIAAADEIEAMAEETLRLNEKIEAMTFREMYGGVIRER
jgi:hypothetical protein